MFHNVLICVCRPWDNLLNVCGIIEIHIILMQICSLWEGIRNQSHMNKTETFQLIYVLWQNNNSISKDVCNAYHIHKNAHKMLNYFVLYLTFWLKFDSHLCNETPFEKVEFPWLESTFDAKEDPISNWIHFIASPANIQCTKHCKTLTYITPILHTHTDYMYMSARLMHVPLAACF